MVSTATIDGVDTQTIKWNPVPISTHATHKECENAFNDLSGFARRLDDKGWPQYNPSLRCVKRNSGVEK